MRTVVLGVLALAIPTVLAWQAFPPKPGPDNDMPDLVGYALILWWSVVSAVTVTTATAKRYVR